MMMNIWGWKLNKFEGMKERRIFFFFLLKKKTFWKNQQKNNRKSRQNLCMIKSVVIATYDDAIATFSNLEKRGLL